MATTTRPAELVLDAKIYLYVDLDDNEVTHVEIDFDRQPSGCDPADARDQAWTAALGRGHRPWPTASFT